MIAEPAQCMTCLHYRADGTCAAFPNEPGPPLEIYDMRFDHRNPFPGDRGIRWEPRDARTQNPFDEDSTQG